MENATLAILRHRQAKRQTERLGREHLLHRAAYLPPGARAIVTAFLDLGLPVRELALLHRTSPRQMRRRLDRLRETLSDPCFLLTAKYGARLPAELRTLARAYWLEGRTLRELAELQRLTLHRIRHELILARSMLLIALSVEKAPPGEAAEGDEDAR